MLRGEFYHALDAKGRVNFPSKIRDALGERFFLTRGLDGCLFVYSAEGWGALEDKLRALPISKSRDIQRFFLASVCEVEPDKQGRILIPTNLREYAGLDKDIVIIGVSERAEIWNSENWNAKLTAMTTDIKRMEETMDELGF
ncbi:MAG: division/cell wall cluster transcriptional repressor MraZ [Oscillospiraceae bacterium]|nr:division/cell wall cluster transcriptional repressor MraZ [Oscillospiraceae bacterium]